MVLRLFPLPDVVLLPNAVLPLHIFEHRYRQMTEDALAGDRLVTIVKANPPPPHQGVPVLEEYACVGRILQYERLADGKFNVLLLGLRRVRLVREVPSGKMYRAAQAEVVADLVEDGPAVEEDRRRLLELFRSFMAPHGGVHPDLDEVISAPLPAGALTDILAHALPLPAEMKQHLLAERQVEIRLDTLNRWLESTPPGPAAPPERFPPRFSVN